MTGIRFFLLAACSLLVQGTHAQDAIEEGKRLFTREAAPLCAVCHTLRHAGATGQVGPDLDELRPDAARVEKAMRNGIGQMPPNSNLSDAQIRQLAKYVETVAGK
jgi:cytochrome c6